MEYETYLRRRGFIAPLEVATTPHWIASAPITVHPYRGWNHVGGVVAATLLDVETTRFETDAHWSPYAFLDDRGHGAVRLLKGACDEATCPRHIRGQTDFDIGIRVAFGAIVIEIDLHKEVKALGHRRETFYELATALLFVIATLGLPRPAILSSSKSGGLHAVFVLRDPIIDPDLFERTMEGLREAIRAALDPLIERLGKVDDRPKDCTRLWGAPLRRAKDGTPTYDRPVEIVVGAQPVDAALLPVLPPPERPAADPLTLLRARANLDRPGVGDVRSRARSYIATIEAISGAHGDDVTYDAALALVHGFLLDPETALDILSDWNLTNTGGERWSEGELRHKIDCAARFEPREPGWLLRPRAADAEEGGAA